MVCSDARVECLVAEEVDFVAGIVGRVVGHVAVVSAPVGGVHDLGGVVTPEVVVAFLVAELVLLVVEVARLVVEVVPLVIVVEMVEVVVVVPASSVVGGMWLQVVTV